METGIELTSRQATRETSELSPSEAAARAHQLFEQARAPRSLEERCAALDELIELHAILEGDDVQSEREAEMAFLLLLRNESAILENDHYRSFVARCIEKENFYRLDWETVEEVITVAEVLYGFRFKDELSADQLTSDVRDLVRHALRQFERQEEPEKMFELLQRAPVPPSLMDAELVRLRNRLHLYEMRRVSRKRRLLYAYIALQVLLILVVFPLLFQNFENLELQRQVEEATGLEIVDGRVTCTPTSEGQDCVPPFQILTFEDSVYWSVVTYSTIGYGDVRPVTNEGKLLAGLHGLMGVLTTGVIAGLILNWITPRDL